MAPLGLAATAPQRAFRNGQWQPRFLQETSHARIMFQSFLGVLLITLFVFLAVWATARVTLGK